ncbi:MAG: SCO family protein [Aliidongia sp.]
MTDQDGRIRTDQSSAASCSSSPSAIPTARMSAHCSCRRYRRRWIRSLRRVAGRVVPLFISVDPEHDTPDRLRRFVAAFSPAIIGLTGSRQEIGKLVQDYHVHVAAARPGHPAAWTIRTCNI